MTRIPRPYRFVAVAMLTALAWSVALPVVQLACAATMASHAGDMDGMKSHARHAAQASDDGATCPADSSTECCVMGAQPFDRIAPQTFVVAPPTVHVAVAAEVSATRLLALTSPRPLRREGSPPPVSPHILFSVLLI